MFTPDQIKAAHSQVKSGADFPAYIQNIKKLGVTHYETFVANGNTEYYGANGYKLSSGSRYETLGIHSSANAEQFNSDLQAHQQGNTDFLSFCKQCAQSGVNKWVIKMEKMTCTYYDTMGNEVLMERIPG